MTLPSPAVSRLVEAAKKADEEMDHVLYCLREEMSGCRFNQNFKAALDGLRSALSALESEPQVERVEIRLGTKAQQFLKGFSLEWDPEGTWTYYRERPLPTPPAKVPTLEERVKALERKVGL